MGFINSRVQHLGCPGRPVIASQEARVGYSPPRDQRARLLKRTPEGVSGPGTPQKEGQRLGGTRRPSQAAGGSCTHKARARKRPGVGRSRAAAAERARAGRSGAGPSWPQLLHLFFGAWLWLRTAEGTYNRSDAPLRARATIGRWGLEGGMVHRREGVLLRRALGGGGGAGQTEKRRRGSEGPPGIAELPFS